jgi:hypothetical protein
MTIMMKMKRTMRMMIPTKSDCCIRCPPHLTSPNLLVFAFKKFDVEYCANKACSIKKIMVIR